VPDASVAGGRRQRRHCIERREREQGQRRDQDAIERAGVVRRDGHCKHAHGGESGDEDEGGVRESRHDCVAARNPGEPPVQLADASECVLLTAERDELRRAAEQLDELGRQRAADLRLPPPHVTGEPIRDCRNEGAGEHEADCEYHRGGGQHERDGDDRCGHDDERDERRGDPAQVQALQRIDVADEARHQVTTPERVQLPRGERLHAPIHGCAYAAERAEGEIVRNEALEVPRERASEREEADDDDRRRQREDRRLLGRPGDQVAGGRHQGDSEADGERSEHDRRRDPSAWQVCEREEPSDRRDHATSNASATRPPSRRTTRSARDASSGRCATRSTVRP
jgi:hypothetical protein